MEGADESQEVVVIVTVSIPVNQSYFRHAASEARVGKKWGGRGQRRYDQKTNVKTWVTPGLMVDQSHQMKDYK